MRKVKLFGLLVILFSGMVSAQKIRISGYIKDAETGEKLIGATLYEKNTKQVAISNDYGFYSLSIPKRQTYVFEVSYIGYKTNIRELSITKNQNLNFKLTSDNNLEEVIITASKEKPIEKRTEMSRISIPVQQMKSLPAIGGESDIIKSLQLMPGIQSGSEGMSQLFVRGGSADQNLILLDDVPMYYVSHLGGFVSTFNTDAISKVEAIKGGFPAKYGNRLSSIINIRMKEGNLNKFEGNAMLGMIASKISIEAPIKKDTTSYIISYRRLLYDLISMAGSSISSKGKSIQGYHFYDFNAKINHHFSDKNHLYLSTYLGDDKNYYKTKDKDGGLDQNIERVRWGNRLVALRWNHLFSQKLFSNTTLAYTRYRFMYENERIVTFDDVVNESNNQFKSGISDLSAKIDFEYYANPNYQLKFGANATDHSFSPGVYSYQFKNPEETQDTLVANQRLKAKEMAVYTENQIQLGRLSLNLGFRYNLYRVDNENFHSFEPRLLGNLLLTNDLSLKASYAKMQQSIHLLTTSGTGMPIDLWVPATKRVIPEKSQQLALGIAKTFNKKYEFSVETYYKKMENLTTYKEGVSYANPNKDWQDKVEIDGKGLSYGIELLLQKKQGKTTGWLGYTWSKSTRQFENVNFGKIYPFRYDRRHDISLVANHRLTDNIDISATWVFGTGNAITLATSKYQLINTPTDSPITSNNPWNSNYSEVRYYSGKNAFRMRAFHKLDLGIRFHKKKKHGTQTWNFSIYNAYNRQNPYYYFYLLEVDEGTNPNNYENYHLKLKQQSLFPIVPSVSYSFKF